MIKFNDIKLLNKDFEVDQHQYVVVDGERIKYVGANEPEGTFEEIIDGHNKFLMPAFYNTHCHVPMTLLRGYGEGLPLQRWLNERIFPFEANFKAEEKYWGAKIGACELIKSGCVSISDNYFDLPIYGESLYEAGMKANLSNPLMVFGEGSYFTDNSYRDTCNLVEYIKNKNDDRLKVDISVHSEYCSTLESAKEACQYAKEKGLIITFHASETKKEFDECKERHNGLTPIQFFKEAGAFDCPTVAAHCVWLTDEDMKIMKDAGAVVSHNPSSNLKLASGIAPIKKYYDYGMKISFGTDGASSNNNLDMLEEIQLAALLCRGQSYDANAIPVKDVLRMATLEGALAQGRTDCGTIEKGKRADLIMFNLDTPNMQPDYDTASNVLFAAKTSDIVLTMCDGTIIYKDGELKFVDEEKTVAEANKAFNTVIERTNAKS